MLKFLKIMFGIIFWPIALPVWLLSRSKKKRQEKKEAAELAAAERAAADREYRLMTRSSPYDKDAEQHFTNVEVIGQMYGVAKNSSGGGVYFSKKMEKVIQACLEDIELAPAYRKWWYRAGVKGSLPDYYTFKRLAIIYEKRKEYDKAIDICNKAIAMGFTNDGTEGGMRARKEKLVSLQKAEM